MNKLKKLFSDYVSGKSTEVRKHIVDLWYDVKASSNADTISDEEADEFSRKAWNEFVARLNQVTRRDRRIPLRAYGGLVAAAMALLVMLLNFPFSEKTDRDRELITTETRIAKQFTTDEHMKKIGLPDGSTIYMNRGTTISIDERRFNAYVREVWLDEGEAYFEVTKDPQRPFIVHTPNGLSTRVVGTSFNIKAYKELEEQVVSVNRGRVQVTDNKQNNIVVDPNNQVSFNYENGKITSGRANANNISAWQNGIIMLENAGMREVAFRLKQVYGIELDFDNCLNQQDRIYANFTTDTPLREVLDDICKLYDTHYTKTNNLVKLFN